MQHHRRRPSSKPRTSPAALERLHPHAAGIDCGSAEHVVAVPPHRDPTPVRAFATFTGDLHRLAEWLGACRVTHVAMEATGVYWIPILRTRQGNHGQQSRCFHVAAAQMAVESVPHHATKDTHDAEPDLRGVLSDDDWLADLHDRAGRCPTLRVCVGTT